MVYKQQNLFLIVLEAERLKIKVAAELVSGEGLLPVHSDSSHCGSSERVFWGLVYQGTIPYMMAPPLWPDLIPEAQLSNIVTEEFGGDTNIQSISDNKLLEFGVIRTIMEKRTKYSTNSEGSYQLHKGVKEGFV